LTCVFFCVFKQYAKRSNGNTNTLPKDESYYIRNRCIFFCKLLRNRSIKYVHLNREGKI